MKHRTWITEALRLHFEERYPGLWPGVAWVYQNQQFVVCSCAFGELAFRGLCPQACRSRNLMPAFTDNFPRVRFVRPESTVISEAPVVKKRPRRPNFPYEFKIALVESLQPGACVAQIAGKTESTITCSSTGAINTGKVACCLPEKICRHCFP